MDIREQIRAYICENFLYTDSSADLKDDISLFDNGIIDSTGVLELVGHIEETWDVQVDDTELVADNFDSIDKITRYIERKLG